MANIVDPLIKSHKVMVFSKSSCPYCDKAKRVLAKYDIKDKHIIELDKGGYDEGPIQDYLQKITGARTVPRVFIAGQCIGGGDDTERLDKQNKLKPMLEQAGAL